jgi:hypothetical protein
VPTWIDEPSVDEFVRVFGGEKKKKFGRFSSNPGTQTRYPDPAPSILTPNTSRWSGLIPVPGDLHQANFNGGRTHNNSQD